MELNEILELRLKNAKEHMLRGDFAALYAGKHIVNVKAYWHEDVYPILKSTILDAPEGQKDYSELEKIESFYYNYDEARRIALEKAMIKEKALNIIKRCDAAVLYIVEFNTMKYASGDLTIEDLDVLESTFSDVMVSLNNKRPEKAAVLIEQLDLTNTIYTEVEREEIINILRQ